MTCAVINYILIDLIWLQGNQFILTWFYNNGMKANGDKCHFLVSTKVSQNKVVAKNDKCKIKINNIGIESRPQEIL